MLEITKTIEASIGPKKLLQQWKLRHAIFALVQFTTRNAGKHTTMRQLPKDHLQ